jgi:hypothetical protein
MKKLICKILAIILGIWLGLSTMGCPPYGTFPDDSGDGGDDGDDGWSKTEEIINL